MTGRAIIESILDYFAEYNRGMDLALEERDVWPILCDITNRYAKIGLFDNMKLGDDPNLPEHYTVNFKNQPIYLDSDFDLCYTPLPAIPISLPNSRGIDFASSMRNRRNAYIICNRNQVPMISSGGKKYYSEGAVFCWQEDGKIYYDTIFDATTNIKVFVRLAVSGANSIGMDVEFPIDPAMLQTVRDEVIGYFMKNDSRAQDLTKDSRQEG